eukprot:TRINITY_DN43901_c0_g1_i1.p1 TRINITY_DN43901_c0_g1~~TRINITY_DN43901_c0_g1_i1.p1  ORF type:complete len:602 (+),score=84.42 TRINITY_DN43901_c0_g1_i1:94-1899(+)
MLHSTQRVQPGTECGGVDVGGFSMELKSMQPPPGLGGEVLGANSADKRFSELLRVRSLPQSLTCNRERRDRFELAVLSCVEGLYRDRIAPSVGELQMRLRGRAISGNATSGSGVGVAGIGTKVGGCGEWSSAEVRGVLAVCARDSGHYIVLAPALGNPPKVLLRNPPSWFEGWIDEEAPASQQVMNELHDALALSVEVGNGGARFAGGIATVASLLSRKPKLQPKIGKLSLGELRQALTSALIEEATPGKLAYDPFNGRCMMLRQPPVERTVVAVVPPLTSPAASVPSQSPVVGKAMKSATAPSMAQHQRLVGSASGDVASLAGAAKSAGGLSGGSLTRTLRRSPFPEKLALAGADKVARLQAELRGCIEGLYDDCVRPTLREVEQRLRTIGWGVEECRAIPLLAARAMHEYEIVEPSTSTPFCILLRRPPASFTGWLCDGHSSFGVDVASGRACAGYSAAVHGVEASADASTSNLRMNALGDRILSEFSMLGFSPLSEAFLGAWTGREDGFADWQSQAWASHVAGASGEVTGWAGLHMAAEGMNSVVPFADMPTDALSQERGESQVFSTAHLLHQMEQQHFALHHGPLRDVSSKRNCSYI